MLATGSLGCAYDPGLPDTVAAEDPPMTRFPMPTRPIATRAIAAALSIALAVPAWAQGPDAAHALPALVPTAQAMPDAPLRTGDDARARLLAELDRAEVARGLAERGLSAEIARDRVAALTDDEARELAGRIDRLPAGGNEILTSVLFIFMVLLITDILGFTKVFPFTRAVR